LNPERREAENIYLTLLPESKVPWTGRRPYSISIHLSPSTSRVSRVCRVCSVSTSLLYFSSSLNLSHLPHLPLLPPFSVSPTRRLSHLSGLNFRPRIVLSISQHSYRTLTTFRQHTQIIAPTTRPEPFLFIFIPLYNLIPLLPAITTLVFVAPTLFHTSINHQQHTKTLLASPAVSLV
jgi:hypothetical protein